MSIRTRQGAGAPLPLPFSGKQAGSPSLFLRWRLWRNRQIASPAFRKLIARIPLLRGIGNRKANALFRLTGGFIFSQILLAGVRLRLYETLADGPAATGPLAARLGVPSGCASC